MTSPAASAACSQSWSRPPAGWRAEAEGSALDVEFVKARVGKAGQQVARVVRLMNNLLDGSRIAAGRLDLEIEDVDLTSVVADVVERLEPEARQLLDLRLTPVAGRWDRLRLDQVVTNLVSNALKYGNGERIEIDVRAKDGLATLTVRDRGIGIPPEDQARIFEQFERVQTEARFDGFGLGLWITRQIVRALGGRISVESSPNAGSTFTVVLTTPAWETRPG